MIQNQLMYIKQEDISFLMLDKLKYFIQNQLKYIKHGNKHNDIRVQKVVMSLTLRTCLYNDLQNLRRHEHACQ